MKLTKLLLAAAVCVGVSACSSGSVTGKVTVEGGSASGVAVFAYGPSSGATVTGSDGAFTLTGLDDGDYVLRAAVAGTDEGEKSTAVTVKGGKAGDVTLAFHFSSGTVTGHVVFADGSDATGLSVVATGPETKSATTEAGGAFTLSNLKSGAYVVTVEAPNTREGRVSIAATASGTIDVGELRLTPVGRLTGTVTYNATAAAGVTVTVPGTSVSSVTDAAGAFELVNVPTGARTVFARSGEAPFWRSASAAVTVARGENAAVDLAMTDDAPKAGTVNGVVTFFSFNDPANISVTVDGLGVTTAVNPSGAFSLNVPVGSWDIVASAPSYPKQVLGHVVVHDGETITLPGQRLSWFQKVWTIEGTINSISSYVSNAAATSFALLTVQTIGPTTVTRLALLNVETGDLRFLSSGSFDHATLSNNGKYAAWSVDSAIYLYTIATGALTTFLSSNDIASLAISEDETTIFAPDSTNGLVRIPIATPANIQRFPADGGAYGVYGPERGRWYVTLTPPPGRVTQVTPTTATTVFASATDYNPLFAGYYDDGGTSALTLLPPDGGAPVIAGEWPTGTYFSLRGGSSGVPCLTTSGPVSEGFCVKMSDGTRVALPGGVVSFATNEPRTRIAFTTVPSDGGVRGLYESALPPAASLAPIDTSASGWNVGWMTPTRMVGIESSSADGRKLRFVTNGNAAAVDTDTPDGGATYILGPMVVTAQKSTGNWRVALGDGPFRTLSVAQGYTPASYAARSGSPVTKYGTFGFYSPSSRPQFVIDENASMVRSLGGGTCGSGFRSGLAELAYCQRDGFTDSYVFYEFQHQMWIDMNEEWVAPTFQPVGNFPVRYGAAAVSADRHSLLLGTFSE